MNRKKAGRKLALLAALIMAFSVWAFPCAQDTYAATGLVSAKIPARYGTGYDRYICIDISNHQGALTVNQFRQIRDLGISGVIIRVGYTSCRPAALKTNTDASYTKNINNAAAAGLKVGAYYYSQARSVAEARTEAAYTVSLLKNYKSKITLPVAFDYEFGPFKKGRFLASTGKKLGKANMTNISIAFCDAIKAAGYTPMFYGNASMLNGYVNRDTLHSKYKIWMANYTNGKATSYSKPVYMWQYSSSGKLYNAATGKQIVKGRIDMNYMFLPRSGAAKTSQPSVASAPVLTGYQKIGDYYFGFDGSGNMYKNRTVKINGKKYKFLKDGKSVLFKAKAKKKTIWRTGPGTKYSKKGKLRKGKSFFVVRKSGKWSQASNGYWVQTKYLKKTTKYPR